MYSYVIDNSLILLRSGDIELNPGPLNNLLQNHPPIHIKRNKLYFMSGTIGIKLKYKSIGTNYEPFLNTNHPSHLETQPMHHYLYRFIHNHLQIHKA